MSCNYELWRWRKERSKKGDVKTEATEFLAGYNRDYQLLLRFASEAEWVLNTRIIEGDTLAATAAAQANEQFAAFTGSAENIEKATEFLKSKEQLNRLQILQLEKILYEAGSNPQTVADIVKAKIKADTKQTEMLFGFNYQIDGKSVSPNEIDGILNDSEDLDERLAAWRASKEVGIGLKDGLTKLRGLKNQSVQALGYDDYFSYQVSDYGMTSDEMMTLCRQLVNDVWPLYRELHTWARYTLAEKYKQDVPEMLPAHWLPNRWGQDWVGLVDVDGFDLDSQLEEKGPEWIIEQGEDFYMSLGFDPLPKSFHDRSSLYPAPLDADYRKNNHASAWHMDNELDVRSLMSIEPNTEWWETTLHELGHIYYYMEYTNEDVPVILRGGANRAYHEAMGSLLGLAAMQKPFLVQMGLAQKSTKIDEQQVLLKEALNYIVLIPWGAGVMPEFEYELYANNLPKDQYNRKWWEVKQKCMGIAPPAERGEEYCDAASKTHINNDAAQYYDYALSYVLLFQFHDHISKNLLHQDPHATNYYGSHITGKFLQDLMRPGSTVDWNEHLQENLGSGMSAKAMLEYFQPLMQYLKTENEGREHTLPEQYTM
ncbi:MAG: M2 family metallopeptidase [Flavobacteriales bacterium]|nr:M2 family metallopeptidase [Flavobacteriales bacterium]